MRRCAHGDSVGMMGEPMGEFKPMPAWLYVYVEDTDATYQRALQSGATSISEPIHEFYGDRIAGVQDLVSNIAWTATHIEDVSAEELHGRAQPLARQAEG